MKISPVSINRYQNRPDYNKKPMTVTFGDKLASRNTEIILDKAIWLLNRNKEELFLPQGGVTFASGRGLSGTNYTLSWLTKENGKQAKYIYLFNTNPQEADIIKIREVDGHGVVILSPERHESQAIIARDNSEIQTKLSELIDANQ